MRKLHPRDPELVDRALLLIWGSDGASPMYEAFPEVSLTRVARCHARQRGDKLAGGVGGIGENLPRIGI